MARTRAALTLVAVAAVAVAVVSGGSSSDPRTPQALPGMPPPFLTAAVVGDGVLTAGIDAYGDVVDLRPRPAGPGLIENPHERQAAGTVPADTGIVPLVSVGGGPALPIWRADAVQQRYLTGTNVLRTVARFGATSVAIECAAGGGRLGCMSSGGGEARVEGPEAAALGDDGPAVVEVSFNRNLLGGARRVHLDDDRAGQILAEAAAADRRWLERARPLGRGAPAWAQRLYERSLLVMRALADRRGGAVAAGARDGWAYVWPRDAGAVAIALAAAGQDADARRVSHFLLDLDLGAAARFEGSGGPVAGRDAQGDAAGWVAAAAKATGFPAGLPPSVWQSRADYQEKSPGYYLANALGAADGPKSDQIHRFSAHRREWRGFVTRRGLVREAGEPSSGLDSAAAWAVRPFPRPALYPAVRRTLLALSGAGARRSEGQAWRAGASRFGIVPSEHWPEPDPWTAPTAWSAWSLAALARRGGRGPAATRDRAAALRLVAALRRAATPAGLLPERVDARTGIPRSTTPLAWSHAFAVLALRELWPEPPILAR